MTKSYCDQDYRHGYNTDLDHFSAVENGKMYNLCPDEAWESAYMTYVFK